MVFAEAIEREISMADILLAANWLYVDVFCLSLWAAMYVALTGGF